MHANKNAHHRRRPLVLRRRTSLHSSNASSQPTALQKSSLRAVACGAVWPKDRLIAAGYDVDPLCELCRADPDTMFHRIWACQNPDAKSAREAVAPQRLIDEALAHGPTSADFCRWLGQDLSLTVPPAADRRRHRVHHQRRHGRRSRAVGAQR